MLANQAYSESSSRRHIDRTEIDQVIEIIKLVYYLAKNDDLSDLSISKDPCFLYELHFPYLTRIPDVEILM